MRTTRPYLHSAAGITVRCFASLEEAAELRTAINALNDATERPDPFSTFEFYENYCRHDEDCAGGLTTGVWFLVAFRAGVIVGYLPLRLTMRRALGLRTGVLGFLVRRDADRPHLVAPAEHAAAVAAAMFGYLLSRRGEWTLLELHQQEPLTELWSALAATHSSRYALKYWPSLEHCNIPVRWPSLQQYLASMTRKFRANLARQVRNLLAAGDVQLLVCSDPRSTPEMLSLYLAVEAHSWKARAHAGISRDSTRMAYFRSLADGSQPMTVSVRILLIDGVPVAGIICGEFRHKLYALQMAYDERYGRLAPGSALLLMVMRHAIDGGFQCLNLLSGFGYFKARWLAECHRTHVVQIYRRGAAPYWRRLLGEWKRRIRPQAPSDAAGPFNPARRDVRENGASTGEGRMPQPSICPEEKQRHAQLIARVRAGHGELLTAPELAEAMPFEV